ncbi:carbohydrate sulfotransferase 5-like isoform X2 [Stylophora pistillata]|uniref:carbohydrate sulfotransferase 5-like isoform X2 n=1 Tax=Stylophora pistillata TaxID=50429 RepID=UPI000C0472A6|nr:carbohydrate sulfotransferase 5-like isoform X2 [Stylophora pistillata]XP_022800536.1 carbohydrate sulfotransferase 5-like isoform X2 [Stylophora pistillata]
MAFRWRIRRNLILLLIFTFISVGLFFALLQTSRDVVKNRNVLQSGSMFITTSNLTTNEAPLETQNRTNSVNDSTERTLKHKVKNRQIVLVVAHGRSGSTFLADIFDKHPRVFYVFEPLHGIGKIQVGDYDTFAMNFLQHIFQCNFSMGNTSKEMGRFFRFYSRALSSPPFCKYNQGDPKWRRKYCSPVTQKKLEHSCKVLHNTVVYKLLLDRVPGQSVERLFHVCEMADVECKIIYLVRDLRPLVMSSRKVAFFREVDRKTRPSLRQFVYSCCEMIERNLDIVKNFPPSLRSRLRLVRFEDLAAEPLQVFDSLYRFAGLEMLENIKQWIVKITQPSFDHLKNEEKRSVSMVRNSLEVLNRWRFSADSCFVDVIERYCRDVMKLMGYIATHGSVEMLQNSTIPLFNKNFTAQNWI